ncbi:DEKNAAC100537 [Brettanomyces naardenensis]|uniref:DEKNAAC100537 n=1 Tax=Brettanomyces naardenensis TaxID=13370 RepID=A0A448YGG3_BRENA|nr:DEKNAAC100537 [Brettanomyces naardenensis]
MQFPPEDVQDLVHQIADLLLSRNETLSVSEGACGGLLSAYLISIPGASRFFDGGRLVYSLRSRLRLSGWNPEHIKSYTGPSEAVAVKFARYLRIEFGSTYVLSETGYAGPSTNVGFDDASITADDAAVGTVYLGITGPNGDKSRTMDTNSSDRAENMQLFAKYCLQFLLDTLKEEA